MDSFAYGPTLLKIIVIVQVIFSTWGYLQPPGGGFMPITYGFIHVILLMFGALSIAKPKSSGLVFMYLMVNVFSILNDIILLSLFQPPADAAYERYGVPASTLNTYRFALGMSIVNIILKPFICFALYHIYVNRGGDVKAELSSIRVSGGSSYNGYSNVDDNVETASPHQRIDNSPPPHSG